MTDILSFVIEQIITNEHHSPAVIDFFTNYALELARSIDCIHLH